MIKLKNIITEIECGIFNEDSYPVIVGIVNDEDGEVKSTKTIYSHSDLGYSRGIKWRYSPQTKILYWWTDPYSRNEIQPIDLVVDHLLKKYGYKVKEQQHVDFDFYDAHGVVMKENKSILENGDSVDIGDGLILKRVDKILKSEKQSEFLIFDPNSHKEVFRCIVITEDHGKKLKIPFVGYVKIFDNSYRGKGLYRRVLPILKKTFGYIRSDNDGMTSDSSEKSWKSVGSENPPKSNSTHGIDMDHYDMYGRSKYILEFGKNIERGLNQ